MKTKTIIISVVAALLSQIENARSTDNCHYQSSCFCSSGSTGVNFIWCSAPCDICLPAFPLICVHATCYTYTALAWAQGDGYIPCDNTGAKKGGDHTDYNSGSCTATVSVDQCDGSESVYNVSNTQMTTYPGGNCGG